MGKVARHILFHSIYVAIFGMTLFLYFFQTGGLEIKAATIIATYVIVWLTLNPLARRRQHKSKAQQTQNQTYLPS